MDTAITVDHNQEDHDRRHLDGRFYYDGKKPKVSSIDASLPFLNESYRSNLACSLARLLENNKLPTLLWGDILHEIHGGGISLPHVSIRQHSWSDGHFH